MATFVALDPFLLRMLVFARQLSAGYAARGAQEGSDHWTVLRREGLFLLAHHGWVAAFLVLGIAGMVCTLAHRPLPWEPPWPPERRLGAFLLLAQILGYTALFAVGFPLFRGQNFLPVAPFTSLVAAWAMAALYRGARARMTSLARPAVAAALLAVPLLLLIWGQLDEVYGRVVPSTWDAAAPALTAALDRPAIRQVAYEGPPGLLRANGHRAVAIAAPSLLDTADAPRLSDAELFVRGGTYDTTVRAHEGTSVTASPASGRREIAPRLFRSSGDTLELRLHPWTPAPPLPLALTPAAPQALVATMPPEPRRRQRRLAQPVGAARRAAAKRAAHRAGRHRAGALPDRPRARRAAAPHAALRRLGDDTSGSPAGAGEWPAAATARGSAVDAPLIGSERLPTTTARSRHSRSPGRESPPPPPG